MFGNIGIWQLLIILVIVILLFGTKRLKSIGSDLGSAVKGFKNSVSDDKIETVEKKESSDADFETPQKVKSETSKEK